MSYAVPDRWKIERNGMEVWGDGMEDRQAALSDRATLDELREILDGINRDECSYESGWWETSGGAQFGADRLAEVLTWGQRALGLPVTDNHEHFWVKSIHAGPYLPFKCRCGAETIKRIDG